MTRYAAGIDLGTAYTKALLCDADGTVLARCMEKTGFQPEQAAQRCLTTALDQAGLKPADLSAVVTTGSARRLSPLRTMAVTELTAVAHGARLLYPNVRTVLDVGAQTVKACRFTAGCRIDAFRLNDKCASGTGAFLERTARIMEQPLDAVDRLVALSTAPAPISSVCAVFAESEIISQLAQATVPADIMHGAVKACADRAAQIAVRVGIEPELCLAGGVLRFTTAAALLKKQLGADAQVPPGDLLQFVAALGAAWLGIRFG